MADAARPRTQQVQRPEATNTKVPPARPHEADKAVALDLGNPLQGRWQGAIQSKSAPPAPSCRQLLPPANVHAAVLLRSDLGMRLATMPAAHFTNAGIRHAGSLRSQDAPVAQRASPMHSMPFKLRSRSNSDEWAPITPQLPRKLRMMMPNVLALAMSDQSTGTPAIRADRLLRDVGALRAGPADDVMPVLRHDKAVYLASEGSSPSVGATPRPRCARSRRRGRKRN